MRGMSGNSSVRIEGLVTAGGRDELPHALFPCATFAVMDGLAEQVMGPYGTGCHRVEITFRCLAKGGKPSPRGIAPRRSQRPVAGKNERAFDREMFRGKVA